jgi:hypothetical protein
MPTDLFSSHSALSRGMALSEKQISFLKRRVHTEDAVSALFDEALRVRRKEARRRKEISLIRVIWQKLSIKQTSRRFYTLLTFQFELFIYFISISNLQKLLCFNNLSVLRESKEGEGETFINRPPEEINLNSNRSRDEGEVRVV